jgi:hypothetical protein
MRDRTGLPDRLRLPFAFDAELLARDLGNLAAMEWTEHFLKDRYIGNWDVIPLRGPAEALHPIMMIAATPGATAFKDTPAMAACPYVRQIIDAFQSEVRHVRLLRLTPGSVLKEHTDHESTSEDGVLRLHIPVVTNSEVYFLLNGTRVVMEAGSAWYLRLREPHSVENRGTTDRVHLLIDVVMNDNLSNILTNTSQRACS